MGGGSNIPSTHYGFPICRTCDCLKVVCCLPATGGADPCKLSSYHPIMHGYEKGGEQQGHEPNGEKGGQLKVGGDDGDEGEQTGISRGDDARRQEPDNDVRSRNEQQVRSTYLRNGIAQRIEVDELVLVLLYQQLDADEQKYKGQYRNHASYADNDPQNAMHKCLELKTFQIAFYAVALLVEIVQKCAVASVYRC